MSKDRFDSRDHLKLQKEAEERQAWRVKNSEHLRWEMFLRNFGPEGDFVHLDETPRNEEEVAAFAHREMLQSILKYYNEEGTADYESMSFEEKAFAHLFDELFMVIEDYELFDMDIMHRHDRPLAESWAICLKRISAGLGRLHKAVRATI